MFIDKTLRRIDPTASMIAPSRLAAFPWIFAFHAHGTEISGRRVFRHPIAVATTKKFSPYLLGFSSSSRSINAAKDALQKMGLSRSEQDLDRVAVGLIEELELRNSRPIH